MATLQVEDYIGQSTLTVTGEGVDPRYALAKLLYVATFATGADKLQSSIPSARTLLRLAIASEGGIVAAQAAMAGLTAPLDLGAPAPADEEGEEEEAEE